MNTIKISLAALTASACMLGMNIPAANASGFANGSFEADDWSAAPGYQFDLVVAGLTGWTVGAVDLTNVYPWGLNNTNTYGAGPAPDGKQWVVLGIYSNNGTEYIEQSLTGLTPNTNYTVSFDLSSEGYLNGFGPGNSQATVSVPIGSSTAAQTFIAPDSLNTYWEIWNSFSYTFLATGTSATVRFTDAGPINAGYDVGIDNVSLKGSSSVPEPASIALMLGLGASSTLIMLRRRRK